MLGHFTVLCSFKSLSCSGSLHNVWQTDVTQCGVRGGLKIVLASECDAGGGCDAVRAEKHFKEAFWQVDATHQEVRCSSRMVLASGYDAVGIERQFNGDFGRQM